MGTLEHFRHTHFQGDSQTVGFLPAKFDPGDLVRTICALANTEGGIIYIGVDRLRGGGISGYEGEGITGVSTKTVDQVIENLANHFDDPLPKVRTEPLDQEGHEGPIVAVHVTKHTGSEQIALHDQTIWERENGRNISKTARVKQLRESPAEAASGVSFTQKAETQVVSPSSVSPERPGEPPTDEPAPSSEQQGPEFGSRSEIRREASDDEVSLNADDYAEVIANLLASADGNERMSTAIFGHWGRGKTFLAKRVMERLERSEHQKYRTVLFSAWKYRTTPEVWAYLFERFRQEAKKDNWLVEIRATGLRHGPWPLILALVGLFISLWTVGDQFQFLIFCVQLLGVGTVMYAAFLFFRFQSTAVRLQTLYSFASHAEKLGLQAAIGDDLRALLQAWCPGKLRECNCKNWGEKLPAVFCYVGIAGLISWKLWPVKTAQEWSIPLVGEVSTGINPYFAFAVCAIWCVCWVVMPFVLLFLPQQPTQRVLLVVDDLDRCEPKQMLEIIESTMLILDDEVVQQRLQICMLIDESALIHALVAKYEQLLDEHNRVPGYQYTADRIYRENLEKFFLVHLRLATLTPEELGEVARGYVGLSESPNEGDSALADEIANDEASGPISTDEKRHQLDLQTSEVEPIVSSELVLTSIEAAAILKFLDHYLRRKEGAVVGPRTIRCLLFRYQLAREILSKLGVQTDPTQLANIVVGVYADTLGTSQQPSRVELVVRQVS